LKHQQTVWTAAFSPDGKTILTGSFDKTARFWDATNGRPVGQPLPHRGPVKAMTFSPDG
jgi:WD40 repeat protein